MGTKSIPFIKSDVLPRSREDLQHWLAEVPLILRDMVEAIERVGLKDNQSETEILDAFRHAIEVCNAYLFEHCGIWYDAQWNKTRVYHKKPSVPSNSAHTFTQR